MLQFGSILFAVLGYAAVACAQPEPAITRDGEYWVRTIQGKLDVSAGGRLRVQTSGNLSVKGTPTEQSSYAVTLRVRAGDAREAEALLDRFNVKTGTEGGWTYLQVTPPRLVFAAATLGLTVSASQALQKIRAQTGGGNIQASDLDGDFEALSAGGRIAVDRIGGRSELRTAGGDIEIGTVSGPVRAISGGGTIRVDNAGAEAWLDTAGGEIFVHRAGGPVQAATGGGNIRIDRATGAVTARTAGGLIQIQQAGGPVTAQSSGGAIQVNSAQSVRCESAGGAIRLRNVAGSLHAFANSGSIMAELVSGRSMADSILSTNAGDITVLIPSNLALTVKAMNESGGTGRIISDFPQFDAEPRGLPGGPVIAEGSLNGGGPMLRVNVVGGTIYLRRAK